MIQYTFTVNGHLAEPVARELEGLSVTAEPSTVFPMTDGATVIQYMAGQTSTSVYCMTFTVRLPDVELQWFDRYSDVPVCSGCMQKVPSRFMQKVNGVWYSPEFFTDEAKYTVDLLKKLDHLAYVYRLPGDRVKVPVSQVYAAAKALGEFVPKNQPNSTADRMQDVFFTLMSSPSYPEQPLPEVAGSSGFDLNKKLIISYPFCRPADIPSVCTLMIEKPTEKELNFLGDLKERLQLTVIPYERRGPFESDYGDKYLLKMHDVHNNRLDWWTDKKALEFEFGKAYEVKATVKEHSKESGEPVTVVTRVRISS